MKKRLVLKASTCTLSCPCGAPVIVDGRHPEGVQVCVICRQSLRIVVSIDPKTKKRRVGILVAPQAVTVKTEAVKPVKAASPKTRVKPPVPAGPQEAQCKCGSGILVNPAQVDAIYTCVGCGACYSAVARVDPQTGVSKPQLMAVDTIPLDETQEVQAAPASKPDLAFSSHVIGAQPLKNRGEDVLVSCFCGREIPVNPDEHRQDLSCPGCSLSFQLVMAVEPGTHRPMAVTLPRPK